MNNKYRLKFILIVSCVSFGFLSTALAVNIQPIKPGKPPFKTSVKIQNNCKFTVKLDRITSPINNPGHFYIAKNRTKKDDFIWKRVNVQSGSANVVQYIVTYKMKQNKTKQLCKINLTWAGGKSIGGFNNYGNNRCEGKFHVKPHLKSAIGFVELCVVD